MDQDCDESVDEGLPTVAVYADGDGDGAGVCSDCVAEASLVCRVAIGEGTLPGDCADGDPEQAQGFTEICDGQDNDCDGTTDEAAEVRCGLPGATGACVAGACEFAMCTGGLLNCDLEEGNGCEVDPLSDPLHCGACDAPCVFGPNSTPVCDAGACSLICDPGFTDCDGVASNGCEADLMNDPDFCGSCTTRCSNRDNAAGVCEMGTCDIACVDGFADCDGDPLTGCEVFTFGDDSSCGTCGNACPAGDVCAQGTCLAPLYPSDGSDGAFEPTENIELAEGIHRFTTIFIPADVTVTVGGSGVVELYATGDVVIEGTIDVSGTDGGLGGFSSTSTFLAGSGGRSGNPTGFSGTVASMCPVPASGGQGMPGRDGSFDGTGCGNGGANGGGAGGARGSLNGGGGGGGFAGGGGGGSQNDVSDGDGGSVGGSGNGGAGGVMQGGGEGGESGLPIYGGQDGGECTADSAGAGGGGSIGFAAADDLAVGTTFQSGSGGGGGGTYGVFTGGGGGGGGGGAIRITSPTALEVTSTGRILAEGGRGGDANRNDRAAPGGGGSGGLVYLVAPRMTVEGEISAAAGSGGRTTNSTVRSCLLGGDGGLGRVRISTLPSLCALPGGFDPPLVDGCTLTVVPTPGRTGLRR